MLYNIAGKKIAESKASNHITIDGIASGAYIIVAEINNIKHIIKVVL